MAPATDGRIRYLCYRVVSEVTGRKNKKKLEVTLTELRDVIRLRIAQVRAMAVILAGLNAAAAKPRLKRTSGIRFND